MPILPSGDKLNQVSEYKRTVNELKEFLQKYVKPKFESSYAVAEILIDINRERTREQKRHHSVFTMSSDKTDKLFHVRGSLSLVGVPIKDALNGIKPLIKPKQWKYFSDEQNRLIGELTVGEPDIRATIPFIFKESEPVWEEFRGRAFLGLITEYTFEQDSLLLKMLYYEVPTTPLEKAPDGDYYIMSNP